MKYVVEFKHRVHGFNWEWDEEFSNLPDAIDYAAKECISAPRLQHRIVKVFDVEQVMFFPSLDEVTHD